MSATGYKNVYKNDKEVGKPFYAAVKINRRNFSIGYYGTIPEAAAAARSFIKAYKIFGPKPSILR
jgi:hypothetical protein